jgi:hypothetical protein
VIVAPRLEKVGIPYRASSKSKVYTFVIINCDLARACLDSNIISVPEPLASSVSLTLKDKKRENLFVIRCTRYVDRVPLYPKIMVLVM